MLVEDGIIKIRRKIDDQDVLEYEDDAIIDYMNDALDLLWNQLVLAGSTETYKELLVTADMLLPSDFYKLTSPYPIAIIGQNIVLLYDIPVTIKYFKKPPYLETNSINMPFSNDLYNNIILQVATIILLNKSEFDISQDKALSDEVRKMLS